ncbi:hypothetical protein [Psychrobacter sanguinis]|uniref:hypothetical protein n=1 Tax=Psychrobacter sanguinis TaxID=861445 RepID=UPI000E849E39|nr:hypothetical protein [Psychrobacter sanguinis]HBH34805.1 hypothetical protein [Psychrobacter sp.]
MKDHTDLGATKSVCKDWTDGNPYSETRKHDEADKRDKSCRRAIERINEELDLQRQEKENSLPSCDEKEELCRCDSSSTGTKKVDLVILIDASGSMFTAATAVAKAADEALLKAKEECPSHLRVAWLAVDGSKSGANPAGDLGDITGTLAGTSFTQTHQQYLESIGSTGPFKQDEAQPFGDSTYPGEEGADSIADICNFYDWREGACKAIFYISDTALDGYSAFYDAASTNATAAALANGVVLFAHKITPGSANSPGIIASYDNLTNPTSGHTYHGPVSEAKYVELIKDAICNACGSECKILDLPVIEPCVSIVWGDSKCDCFETDDVETAIISVCNCYSNITLSNVYIGLLTITMEDGSDVPTLPDGTPSVEIIPRGAICFGDIGPCKEGESNCISREIVIRTRGAKSGRYKIHIAGLCYNVILVQHHDACFTLDLCQDR